MDRLNFALIGCGKIGKRHAAIIRNVGNLVAVCDIKPEKAYALLENQHCNTYTSMKELLNNETTVDIVVICTPNGLHAEQSIAALHAGCNVLCEKPMALTVEDCRKMILAAEENEKKLFIVKQNRFNPPVIALKKALDENKLGKIYSVQLNCFWNRDDAYYTNEWRGTKRLDGGILFTQFSHFIDLLYWLVGDVISVFSLTENLAHPKSIEFEDTCVVAARFEQNILATMHFTINSYKQNMEGSLTIFGENGTVKIGGEYLNTISYQLIQSYEIPEISFNDAPNDYGAYKGSMSNHDKVYEQVLQFLPNKTNIPPSTLDALKTVEIIEKIYLAALG